MRGLSQYCERNSSLLSEWLDGEVFVGSRQRPRDKRWVTTIGALGRCAAEAIGATAIAATASVRRRSVRLRREPTTAAAAVTTVTAIGFAHNTDTNAKGRQGGGLLPPSSRFRVSGQAACLVAAALNSASDSMLSFFIND